jgi:DMSO/TMAO reductase YedYZ molybdopterin-dependent catalytic subunit
VSQAREAHRLPVPSGPVPTAPPGDPSFALPGLSPFLTPNGDFYRVDTALVVPQVSPSSWRLRVHGMVDHPVELTYDELLARPMIERDVTLVCVSNEVGGNLTGTATFLGARLADLLREAGVQPGATQLVSRSSDGFTVGTPTSVVLDGRDALIAVGMNGQPLPVEHGFPARLVVPGLYGYVSATKWVTDLELTTLDAYDAYWVQRGWAKQAPIKTESRIDVPRGGANLAPGTVAIAGVAWAPHRGVSKVEVQVDDGPWQPATLGPSPTDDTWRQWVLSWNATAGSHRLSVRATDGTGAAQTAEFADPVPDGATGWHQINVTVKA